MVVSDVKIELVARPGEQLLAFGSIVFDHCFVVRDIKIIQGHKAIFVAMPNRKITHRCTKCGEKNSFQSRFCQACGVAFADAGGRSETPGRSKMFADIAHPITASCRNEIHAAVLKKYHEEVERSRQPGYRPSDTDFSPSDSNAALLAAEDKGLWTVQPPSPSQPSELPQ